MGHPSANQKMKVFVHDLVTVPTSGKGSEKWGTLDFPWSDGGRAEIVEIVVNREKLREWGYVDGGMADILSRELSHFGVRK